jgi:hypothetical protein
LPTLFESKFEPGFEEGAGVSEVPFGVGLGGADALKRSSRMPTIVAVRPMTLNNKLQL